MPLSPGQRLASYEIISPLGAGGMGEVYRARDARLGREVALKVLPADVTNEPGRLERFDREARAIAALNHPHIVTIHSTEEADGIRFLTMELVEGCTLSDLIVPSGMAIPQFIDIAIPLADALAAAHQKQITHRDLKPGNVMVSSDGRVKVLDFGLARVGGSEAGEQTIIATQAPITLHGVIVGTMPYMSPEQVEGRSTDARSDLFSLGVIFYELLSGQRPFTGSSSPALMSSILRDAPTAIGERRADLPDPLTRLVDRLLEKRPEDRIQTARDVYNELRQFRRSSHEHSAKARRPQRTGVENLWIAVLPFSVRGADADAEAMASALTDDIAASLAKFPGLSVVASQTTRAFKDSTLDVRQVAKRLRARYVIAGNVRKSGPTIRITAQAIDATTGEQLWTENFDRRLDEADLFAIQDDVTDHIVATVGDKYGVLAKSMVKSLDRRAIEQSSSVQLLMHSWGFQHRPLADTHAELRQALEKQLAADPNDAHLWAELANMYVVEHSLGFNPLPESIERAMAASRRAIELDRANQTGWLWLAIAHFHDRDRAGFDEASERAIRINPRNAYALAWMGNILTHIGEYERGCALTERAMRINPGHPGWLHFAVFNRHFAAGEYERALQAARRVNMREFFWMHFAIAAACGQLGLAAEGRRAADETFRLAPPLNDERALREFVTRWYWSDDMIEALVEGVRRSADAGVTDPTSSAARSKPLSSASDATSARSQAFAVAIQPFTALDQDAAATLLAERLSDDVRNGLSRFGHFRVLSRQASERGARYRLEGSVRSGDSIVRVSVVLVETRSGENVWAEHFHGDPAGTFALQDDLASRIVATVGDPTGVLVRRMAAALATVGTDQLTVAELVIRYHAYTDQLNAEEHDRLRSGFERALEREPRAAEGWACVSMLYRQEHSQSLNPLPDWIGRQRRAAERAIELNPQSQQAWLAMTSAHLFSRDAAAVRAGVERVIAVNSLNSEALALCAIYLGAIGDYERAAALSRRAIGYRNQHPGWYHFPIFNLHFVRGEYDDALAAAKAININMPRLQLGHIAATAAAGALGRAADATPALDALADIDQALLDPGRVRTVWELWMWDRDYTDRIADSFRKALAISGRATAVASSSSSPVSGSIRPGAPTIAVLPFVPRSSDDESKALADGLTDDITTGLSKFGYLRVLPRSASEKLPRAHADMRAQARYALEGSVRRSGATVRISLTLVDTQTATNLWTNSYDRTADSGTFAIQDDVASAVVATLGDQTGVLMRAMVQSTTDRPLEQLSAADLVVRYHLYAERFDPAEHAQLRGALERALEREPAAAEGWACLAFLYQHEYSFGFNPRPDPEGRERRAAERARELDPNSQQAWIAIASVHNRARDREALKNAVERAVSINPLNAELLALSGVYLSVAGEHDRATALVQQAMQLKPQHAGWYYYPLVNAATARGDYTEALRYNKKINMPRMPLQHANAAAFAGHLGLESEAKAALRALRDIDPRLADPESARAIWAGWIWSEAWIASKVDGLTKALQLEGKSDVRSSG